MLLPFCNFFRLFLAVDILRQACSHALSVTNLQDHGYHGSSIEVRLDISRDCSMIESSHRRQRHHHHHHPNRRFSPHLLEADEKSSSIEFVAANTQGRCSEQSLSPLADHSEQPVASEAIEALQKPGKPSRVSMARADDQAPLAFMLSNDLSLETPVSNTGEVIPLQATIQKDSIVTQVKRDLNSICPERNGTIFTSGAGHSYQVLCDRNFPGQDLSTLQIETYDQCAESCDAANALAGYTVCLAALFVPSWEEACDCFLKSGISPFQPATGVELAVLIPNPDPSSRQSPPTWQSGPISGSGGIFPTSGAVVVPNVISSTLHGPVQNHPSDQYISSQLASSLRLPREFLTIGINEDLTSSYGMSADTGVLEVNESTRGMLKPMTRMPRFSRDGGKGGSLGSLHLFMFCDTGSYTAPSDGTNGNFLGFVSSSLATDIGMNAVAGNAIALKDNIGEWADDVGRKRGFIPLTQGERSYSLAMQGHGQRYALWPEASFIPWNGDRAILYAPIVYDNVNKVTGDTVFTYTGAALVTIAAGGLGGPTAERSVGKLFARDEVEWGCIGGIRSWGSSGIGGTDGKIYVFGKVREGLLIGRVGHDLVANRNAYEYWNGKSWTRDMQSTSSRAFFIKDSFMDADIFYSPRHLTFIIVYMTTYADNLFSYRYLETDGPIYPTYHPMADNHDYVENLVKYNWSAAKVLYKAPLGLNGKWVYAGGFHQGYFGVEDIINGGSRMLLSWTAPTSRDAASEVGEYQIITAAVQFS